MKTESQILQALKNFEEVYEKLGWEKRQKENKIRVEGFIKGLKYVLDMPLELYKKE